MRTYEKEKGSKAEAENQRSIKVSIIHNVLVDLSEGIEHGHRLLSNVREVNSKLCKYILCSEVANNCKSEAHLREVVVHPRYHPSQKPSTMAQLAEYYRHIHFPYLSSSIPAPPCCPPDLVLNQDSTHRMELARVCRTELAAQPVGCNIAARRVHMDFLRLATFLNKLDEG